MQKDSIYCSERLTFKGISKDDAQAIVRWRSNPDNYRHFFDSHGITLKEHLAWFERYLEDKTRYDFMVIDPDGKPVGTVGLSNIGANGCEISYMIGEVSARGKGYASETVKAMTGIALRELDVSEVVARILPENDASMHVALSAGFVEAERVFLFKLGEHA